MLDTTSIRAQINEDAFVVCGRNKSREKVPEAQVRLQNHQLPAGFH